MNQFHGSYFINYLRRASWFNRMKSWQCDNLPFRDWEKTWGHSTKNKITSNKIKSIETAELTPVCAYIPGARSLILSRSTTFTSLVAANKVLSSSSRTLSMSLEAIWILRPFWIEMKTGSSGTAALISTWALNITHWNHRNWKRYKLGEI